MENSRETSATRPKEAAFLYSIPTAVFVFDSNIKLVQKIKVADPELAMAMLSKNEWLPEEKEAVRKTKSDGKAIVVLGAKKDKPDDVAFSQDIRKLEAATSAATDEPARLREIVISFTKKAVAESVNDDNLIIQSSSAIAELNKAANLLIKRAREWYELYCPEASRQISSHEEFANAILNKSKDELLKEFRVKETMGVNLEKADIRMILAFAENIKSLYERRSSIAEYVEELMKRHCPNIAAVAGPSTGAELIVQAGSLQRLAMLPSSTIQLLGAERELFRHLKDKKQKPPKAGVLHNHPFVTSAPRQQQGRIAKLLADKISIASRVDYFKGSFAGDRLLEELKKKLETRITTEASKVSKK
ncbi:NOP58 family protein [Candidatus Woesearchaeota archaeon]|nr:NOP58 family protein [Candidatus Woesearchaeota archaeon]